MQVIQMRWKRSLMILALCNVAGTVAAQGIFTCTTLHGYTPDSQIKRKLLDWAAAAGFGDGCNIVAVKD